VPKDVPEVPLTGMTNQRSAKVRAAASVLLRGYRAVNGIA
jgi:hypothetical protein